MKKLYLLIFTIFIAYSSYSQNNKAILLHHSTGTGVYYSGNVREWTADYNITNGADFVIEENSYPSTPYGWGNYPYDYWKLWVDGSCDNAYEGSECLESIAERYEMVIFKHCFPGADVLESDGLPDVTSEKRTIENYKLQYRALREKMDGMPSTKFMFWTLVPRHRLYDNGINATRANQFVEWVRNDFLTEDGNEHPNIYIFDIWTIFAEQEQNPEFGLQYCLKYEYERDHTSAEDGHPNVAAYEYAGPLFAQAVVDALADDLETVDYAPELSTSTEPVILAGESYDLSQIEIQDANNTDATYTYHSASPATSSNELSSTVVTPSSTTNYYILGTTSTDLTDELEVAVTVVEEEEYSYTLSGSLAFGRVTIGSSSSLSFTINNTSTGALEVTSITLPDGFTANWTSGTIELGGSQSISVTFTPTEAIAYSGEVAIVSNGTTESDALEVSGSGSENTEGLYIEDILLVDPVNDEIMGSLNDGDVIYKSDIPAYYLTIEVVAESDEVNSVYFNLSGAYEYEKTEGLYPWVLFGDNEWVGYKATWIPPVGDYSLYVSAHSGTNANGETLDSKMLNFIISNEEKTSESISIAEDLKAGHNSGIEIQSLPDPDMPKLVLSPVPVSSVLEVNFDREVDCLSDITITSITGIPVYQEEDAEVPHFVYVERYPAGVYIVRVQNAYGQFMQTFIKQ
jgi:hypothetical protein